MATTKIVLNDKLMRAELRAMAEGILQDIDREPLDDLVASAAVCSHTLGCMILAADGEPLDDNLGPRVSTLVESWAEPITDAARRLTNAANIAPAPTPVARIRLVAVNGIRIAA